MSDWIEWKGGECPVAPDTLVDINHRGNIFLKERAGDWFWNDIRITQYRLSEPKTTAIPTPSGDQPVSLTDAVNKVEAIVTGIEKLQAKIDAREELRIRAALAAFQGIISHEGVTHRPEIVSEWSVNYAENLIKKLFRDVN